MEGKQGATDPSPSGFVPDGLPDGLLSLMSLCKYGVCSNSTFAWWGAYLMKKKQYIVFPKYWLGWKTKVESHPGIQPPWSNIIDVE